MIRRRGLMNEGITDSSITSDKYLTFYTREDGSFSFSNSGLQYSVNGGPWTQLPIGTNTPVISSGSYIYFKGNLSTGSRGVGTFSSTNLFDVLGNINSIIYNKNADKNSELKEKSQYHSLFSGCSNLINASLLVLPSKNLTRACYTKMFYNCKSLIAAPQLPATSLAEHCYSEMFSYCTSITTAPELPATTLVQRCYDSMFLASGLSSAPELPATTLASYCYYRMFLNCKSLTTVSSLPATVLVNNCYDSMFSGCSNLTSAPELPATTLVQSCYYFMFRNCTSLTTAPELPATTLVQNCYDYMFNNCQNLNYIKAMFTTTPSTSYTLSWLRDVASTGTFVKNSAATWNVTGDSGVPSGWTVLTVDF